MDVPSLPNAMASILSLSVHRRIPITIVEDDSVRPREVNTNPTRAGRQNEDEYTVIIVESLHENLTLVYLRSAIQPKINVTMVVEESFEDIQHARHLGEQQNFVMVGF